MVLKAAIKALKKAERIKEKMQITNDLLPDNDAWVSQQQLQRVYQQVLILDLEYALDKKVEQDLWNHGFKNFIANLQAIAKDKKNPKHAESQAMLYWCLEAASGFYLSLLHEICSAYDLDLPFRRDGSIYGCNKNVTSIDSQSQANKSSCYYICQHCLVHLGDIARYRNQSRQAEAFYKYAVQLSPNSGQPYNQLALLEASRGDKLSMVYHYIRSVALRHPFPAALTNLTRTLMKHAEEVVKLDGHNKLSSYEYITYFLKLHGLLHTGTELEIAEKLVQILSTSLTAHIATESLSSWKIVQMVTINIFALHHASGTLDGKTKKFKEEELTPDERKVKVLISDFLAACLSAFLLPVYTIKPGEPLLDYFAMPAIKLTLEWIKEEPEVLEKPSFENRLQIWPSLCKLLNDVQPTISGFPSNDYNHVPLPEDRDLQGFLLFEKNFQNLKFHTEDLKLDTAALNKLRAARMVDFGLWLSQQAGLSIITSNKVTDGNIVFEALGRQEPPSGEQIREFEEMILTKLPSPTPSEGSGSITGASTPDSSGFYSSLLMNPILKFKTPEFSSQENVQEKRPGILKSQNSTEKPPEKVVVEKVVKPVIPSNRFHRNAALQALLNRNAEETKQVTFKTPSPTPDPVITSPKKQNQSKTETKVKKLGKQGKKQKDVNEENEKADMIMVQQQKLMEVLNPRANKKSNKAETPESLKSNIIKEMDKETPFPELMSAFPPLPSVKDDLKTSSIWNTAPLKEIENGILKPPEDKTLGNVNKQLLLSELFNKSKPSEFDKQPQHMSGLLNLNKQQQEMLANSKQANVEPFTKADFPPIQKLKTVDRMEAARKEYELAMFAIQQKQEQEAAAAAAAARRFQQGICEPDLNQFEYERRLNLQQQQQQQQPPQMFVQVNQPLINMGSFGFKYPQMFVPWQEPEQPPMPPSWWSETPQNRQPQPVSDNFGPPPSESMFSQPSRAPTLSGGGNSYSLFSSPSWNTAKTGNESEHDPGYGLSSGIMSQQSFWSGPGPSPLERLLEQQKQSRETPTDPKSGT